jgi:tight adherence protein C
MEDALIVAAIVFAGVLVVGGAALAIVASRRRIIHQRLQGPTLAGPSAEKAGEHPLLSVLNRIGVAVSGGATSRTLAEHLAHAGYYGRSAPGVYLGLKLLLLVAGLAGAAVLLAPTSLATPLKSVMVVAAGLLLFFVPNAVVELRRRHRREEIRRHFPDAIDLIEICVSAGMGLEMAWNLVVQEVRYIGRDLCDEMALTDLEVHLGVPRMVAIKHMAERTGVQEISSLATMIVQTERFGTSIAAALRTFADAMREDRSLRAQEAAERTAVKLIFPLVVFIFPAVLVVLVGPAAIRLAEMIRFS